MRKKSTRFLSAALAACMMVSALPVGAFAAAPAAASTESAVSTQAEEEFVQPESVEINSTNFQDTNFQNYVKRYDTDGNGSLSLEERNKVTTIELPDGLYCPTMKGIEYFPELVTLKCPNANVRSLDVSKNLKLETLWCFWNSLKQLDVSKNKALKDLRCGYNYLTTLNVSQNEALEHLSTNDMRSKLNSLDVSYNKALKHLECMKNGLTSLDVSSNEALERLVCDKNPLTELDVSKNDKLTSLDCKGCGLTSLKFDSAVSSMDCSENLLTELDVSQNTRWSYLRCNDNKLTSLSFNENAVMAPYADIYTSNNHYQIAVDADGIYDLSQLPGNFDVSKTSDWTNGEQNGTVLRVTPGSTTVTYKYDTGNTYTGRKTFNLDVHWHNYQWGHDGTEHRKVCTTANCPGLTANQEAEGPHTFASAKDAACADGCGYTRPLYTVTVKNATAILGDEELNAPVAAGTKVTLTADTTPEDKELHGWKLYKVAADGTETEITSSTELAKLLKNGTETTATLTMPAYNVKAKPYYENIQYQVNAVDCTVTLNDAEVTTAAKGDVITATPKEQEKFTGWKVTKTVNGVEVDITDELRDVSQNGLTIAELTMPAADVTIEALFDDDSGPDLDQPGVTDDGSGDIVAGVVIGGIAAVGAYEAGTGIYRLAYMRGIPLPSDRIELAELVWERAGKPEPESTALYSDISAEDTDAQKAARWAVEQELLKDDTNEDEQKFHPAFPVSKLRVCLTWEKAKQKGLFDQNTEA